MIFMKNSDKFLKNIIYKTRVCLFLILTGVASILIPSRLRAIGKKGKALNRISGGSGRESISVLTCVAADEAFLPPFIIFKGITVQPRWTSEKDFPS
jgi:hypothetical protein